MNADAIQKFFISHGEKFVVGIVVTVSAWLAYGGLSVENILDEQQPDKLTQDANTVRSSIDEDHTEVILPERKSDFQIVAETLKRQRPIDPSIYSLPNLMERRSVDVTIRRKDPILVAPRSIQTHGIVSAIALLSPTGKYAASDLEGAEALEIVETKPKMAPRGGSRNRRNMMMMMEQGMDPSMMSPEMMDMDMMREMMGGEMTGPGMVPGSVPTPQGRAFDVAGDFGHRPLTKDNKKPVPVLGLFIAGTAVLPHKSVAESFKSSLADADGYQPLRDQPVYYDYQVQRADATDKSQDQLKEADWVLVRDRERDLKRALVEWAGFAPELVPDDYRDPQLTGYIPPVLLTDYAKFTLHPMIPMVSRQQKEMAEAQAQAISDANVQVKTDDLELAAPGVAGGNFGMDEYGMEYGMEMSYEGMGMGGYAMAQVEVDPVEYKILRFFDFASRDATSIRPGRSYVYRIRYAVVDPNFPANPIMQPKMSTLSPEVHTRIEPLRAQAVATKQRDYRRWSEWSEPSPPTMLPPLNDCFAGPAQPAKTRTVEINGKKLSYPREQPTATIVLNALSIPYASRMPIWLENVRPGSTLSFKGAAEVLDPIALMVKKVPEAEVLSQTTIIDIAGGSGLPLAGDDETMTEPGMMLLYDENGNLKVTGEVGDQKMYRIYSFAKERGL